MNRWKGGLSVVFFFSKLIRYRSHENPLKCRQEGIPYVKARFPGIATEGLLKGIPERIAVNPLSFVLFSKKN
jgi:hypothetical protein